jgi:hypothetical protein
MNFSKMRYLKKYEGFANQTCDRCGKKANSMSMSYLNTEECCQECLEKEKSEPDYQEAKDRELEELKKGNRNYVGLRNEPIRISVDDAELINSYYLNEMVMTKFTDVTEEMNMDDWSFFNGYTPAHYGERDPENFKFRGGDRDSYAAERFVIKGFAINDLTKEQVLQLRDNKEFFSELATILKSIDNQNDEPQLTDKVFIQDSKGNNFTLWQGYNQVDVDESKMWRRGTYWVKIVLDFKNYQKDFSGIYLKRN